MTTSVQVSETCRISWNCTDLRTFQATPSPPGEGHQGYCATRTFKGLLKNQNCSSLKVLDREGNGTPLQCSCLENPMDGEAWGVADHGVAKSQKRLSDFTFTFYFHALEKEMATHSSVLAWRIPGMGEPGGLPSMGSYRVGHDWSDLAAVAAKSWKSKKLWKTKISRTPSRNENLCLYSYRNLHSSNDAWNWTRRTCPNGRSDCDDHEVWKLSSKSLWLKFLHCRAIPNF